MTTTPPSRRLVSSPSATFLLLHLLAAASGAVPLVGVAPRDEEYFAAEVITCRDGSGSFPRRRLNDGFCDCADGTDEPGTSACPEGKFYCKNIGDSHRFLFSSRVNDRICDCCDGSDEYESGISCPNTCRKTKGVVETDDAADHLSVAHLGHGNVFTSKHSVELEDLIQKLRGLRVAIVVELGLAVCILAFCLTQRRTRARRRQYILKS